MKFDVSDYVDAERGLIHGEIFHSQEIYEAELENVFRRSWSFLAHDKMIPKPGDFIQNYIGEDPVVIVRQKDGSVKAFLNQCRHRGMRICRADEGNAKAFMCSFHGWTYDLAGNLIQVPHEETSYPGGLRKEDWGPIQVPLLHNYRGFIFGCWDPTAPSFEEYLGDMAWYVDSYFDRYDGGLEPVALHKWVIGCNWKFNAEQAASDMSHGETTHASVIQVMALQDRDDSRDDEAAPSVVDMGLAAVGGAQYSDPYGHGAGWFNHVRFQANPKVLDWELTRKDEIVSRIGEDRFIKVRGHANIFPNLMILSNGTIRLAHPRGPNEFEMWAWTFVPVDAPEELKETMRVDVLRTFSPGGMFEQDDAENWLEEQRILRGRVARQSPLAYTAHLGTERSDVDGYPGRTVPHCYADHGARGMYQHWSDLMSGASWSEIAEMKARRAQQGSSSQTSPESAGKGAMA
ncbi:MULTISPECIES: aromatic ring-hydroxylating dioxygenase subunit alpha [unclassified Gordonia (in: high G+C Gram-positive bacteria)]|uniref:aromatic ring-hydroxylating oxygenase subunit alpha n=1 Tax=unclassified Gordonia (in: high G+C Gram-positive bacteria) TaxID=2657482 RepID=UPI0009AC9462|nr:MULTISPECIES: aromatic ring-hydroxylating dioxygenase subunit alpha [unclassified Gordonia (in: high G+C Gram-positive bacteria)]MDF3282991.1 aromatic ring-hydroxylating dioxygenase subunit alpha [Gordonia sp. N1V]OPX10778.1 hypothetical protein B1964_23295 [Gordonia sp. i37]